LMEVFGVTAEFNNEHYTSDGPFYSIGDNWQHYSRSGLVRAAEVTAIFTTGIYLAPVTGGMSLATAALATAAVSVITESSFATYEEYQQQIESWKKDIEANIKIIKAQEGGQAFIDSIQKLDEKIKANNSVREEVKVREEVNKKVQKSSMGDVEKIKEMNEEDIKLLVESIKQAQEFKERLQKESEQKERERLQKEKQENEKQEKEKQENEKQEKEKQEKEKQQKDEEQKAKDENEKKVKEDSENAKEQIIDLIDKKTATLINLFDKKIINSPDFKIEYENIKNENISTIESFNAAETNLNNYGYVMVIVGSIISVISIIVSTALLQKRKNEELFTNSFDEKINEIFAEQEKIELEKKADLQRQEERNVERRIKIESKQFHRPDQKTSLIEMINRQQRQEQQRQPRQAPRGGKKTIKKRNMSKRIKKRNMSKRIKKRNISKRIKKNFK